MANYLVLYTIKNDSDRQNFSDELEKIGLLKFDDQSTNFGSYNGLIFKNLLSDLKSLTDKLSKNDRVYLFYTNELFNKSEVNFDYKKIK